MALRWTVCAIEELTSLAGKWDELNRTAGNMPFLDCAVVQYYCRDFGIGSERAVMCESDGNLVAAAIVQPAGHGRWQTFQPAQSPLGLWLNRPDCELDALLNALAGCLPGFCTMLGITQQDPDVLPRPRASRLLETLDYIETARVSIKSPFEEYWQARGSNLRQNLKKQRNRLAREGVVIRLERVHIPEHVGAAVDDYGRLESAGWKGQEATALHPDNRQGRFYRDMFRHCALRDEASVYRYFFDERLVASDLCVHRDGVLTVLKTAFDASDKSLSPSLLMKEKVFEQLFAEPRMRRVEFYGRVMEWHRRWTDEIRTLYHINRFRWGWLRQLRRRRNQAARSN